MRKIIKFFFRRFFWTVLFLFAQLGFIFLGLRYLESAYSLAVFNMVLGLVVSVMVFSRDDASEYKLSWILFISVVPIFGCSMYLIFGNKKKGMIQQRRAKKYKWIEEHNSIDAFDKAVDVQQCLGSEDQKLSSYVSNLSPSRVYANTSTRYYPLGDYIYPDMLEELRKAKRYIFMEYFIYMKGQFWNSILEILKSKVGEGVDVRVMYDDMGSIGTLPGHYYKELRRMGIKAVAFNPVRLRLNPKLNFRDHRKVTIIDGNVAISGGINISDEYINRTIRFGHWKDNGFIIKGDGVWNYTFMFLQLWSYQAPHEYLDPDFSMYMPTEPQVDDGYIQSFGDSPLDDFNVAENAYMSMINSAKRYVWIATPYLILDEAMTNALVMAARSGVDVRIVTPGVPDKKIVYALTKAYYRPLLQNGVRVFEYTPGFIHSKMFVSDDRTAIVGTTNMDFRSFFLHFESCSVFYGCGVVGKVKADFTDTFGLCHEVSCEEFQNRSWLLKFTALLAKIVAPML